MACWECVASCPKEAIGKVGFLWHKHIVFTKPDCCTGCKICIQTCPQGVFGEDISDVLGGVLAKREMDKKMNNLGKSFNGRAFVSIVTLLFFISLAVSGIMLQVTDHQPLGFGMVYWHVVHNFSAIVFLVFASVHIVRNGKALKSYISKAKNFISKELVAGLILLMVILLGCWLLSEHLVQFHHAR
ncbi:MAG: DUF4405 domain-containing protein [Prevotellaceae bacterium]|nr:DUF4405 domain-containing protein [Prevotellaceae bacterium]